MILHPQRSPEAQWLRGVRLFSCLFASICPSFDARDTVILLRRKQMRHVLIVVLCKISSICVWRGAADGCIMNAKSQNNTRKENEWIL